MVSKEVIIQAVNGLHTRPAALFVKEAQRFNSNIMIENNGKQANAKSLFKLQLLNLAKNSPIQIIAEGDDQQDAVDHLASFILSLN